MGPGVGVGRQHAGVRPAVSGCVERRTCGPASRAAAAVSRARRARQRTRRDACRSGAQIQFRERSGRRTRTTPTFGRRSGAFRPDAHAAPPRSCGTFGALEVHQHRAESRVGPCHVADAVRAGVGGATARRRQLRDAHPVLPAALVGARARGADADRDDVGRPSCPVRSPFPSWLRCDRRGVRAVRTAHRRDSRMATPREANVMTSEPGSTLAEKLGASAGCWAVLWLGLNYLILQGAAADPNAPGDLMAAVLAERMKWEWATALRVMGG